VLLRVENFKSIGHMDLRLAPLTIFVGPPGGGKSNILDAAALVGYFARFLRDEYDVQTSAYEPLPILARFSAPQQLFTYGDIARRVFIELAPEPGKGAALELQYSGGSPRAVFNGVSVPWDLILARLPTLMALNFSSFLSALRRVANNQPLVEARLYGYDRYGLSSPHCVNHLSCGFVARLRGQQSAPYPKNVLSEFGWNATALAKSVRDVVAELNAALEELEVGVEVKFLQSGAVVVFDRDYEVESSSVSDAVFRTLYYLMAVRTSMNYVKLHGLEGRYVVLLEEPEAHVFPYFLSLLANYLARAAEHMYVVVTTHNPLFVSMLWDRVKELKTYYVARDREGLTRAWEVDVGKLARDLVTAEDLLYMPPREVVAKYSA